MRKITYTKVNIKEKIENKNINNTYMILILITMLSKINNVLCDPLTIDVAGFLYGVTLYTTTSEKMLEHPISTILGTLMYGSIYAIGANLIILPIPVKFRSIIPIWFGITSIYEIHEMYKN